MGTEGVVWVLGRAVQDKAPFLQFPCKAPNPQGHQRAKSLPWQALNNSGPLTWPKAPITHTRQELPPQAPNLLPPQRLSSTPSLSSDLRTRGAPRLHSLTPNLAAP